jgi:uncharacterized protein YjbI with pentapeptide repeats
VFCAFHDKSKSEWDDNTYLRFREKVEEAIKTKTSLYCIGYHFPVNISFKLLQPFDYDGKHCQRYPISQTSLDPSLEHDTQRRVYNIPIYLCDADFRGQVEFSHCTFMCSLNLSGAIFQKEVLFRNTIFKGKFYPRNTKFFENVNFRWSKFIDANFHDTIFKDKANFRESVFEGTTKFRNTRFQGKVNFVHSKFYGGTEFLGTTFSEAFFSSDVVFEGKTEFKYVMFENGEKISFVTKNLSNVSFMNTDVTRVKFSDEATWGDTAGDPKDKFKIIEERELQDFFEKNKFWFSWDKVDSDYRHTFITYLNELITLRLVDNKDLKIVKKPDTIRIYMNNTIEYHSDRGRPLIIIELRKGPMVAQLTHDDERTVEFFVKKSKKQFYVSRCQLVSLDSIKAIYRNLRENYEYRLRYDEAGEFFIREMELKRKYRSASSHSLSRFKVRNLLESKEEKSVPLNSTKQTKVNGIEKNGWVRKNISLTGFYHLASYGEKIRMPVILGLTILAISILYWLWYFQYSDEVSLNTGSTNPIWNVTERSLTVFLQLRNVDLIWPDYIFKALGILSLGLFAIPLRRKFERKFRH